MKMGINQVSKITGVNAHTLRAWEIRYGAITPERTTANRRVYSAKELERIIRIRTLNDYGGNISNLANLTDNELEQRMEMLPKDFIKKSQEKQNRKRMSPTEQAFTVERAAYGLYHHNHEMYAHEAGKLLTDMGEKEFIKDGVPAVIKKLMELKNQEQKYAH